MERILDLIYDAAGEHDLWPSVLTAIADATQCEGGILFGQSIAAEQVYFDYNGRLSAECNQVYQERHMQNPWSVGMEDKPVGRLVLSDEVVPLSKLENSSFYDEVLRPQGVVHNAMIALAAKDDFRVAFNICRRRNNGEFGSLERKTLEFLAPHLCRSVTLGFRLSGYAALRNAAFDVIETLADGVVLMGPRGYVLFANSKACSLEEEGTLRLRPSIATWSSLHSRRLIRMIGSTLAGGAGGMMSLPSFDRSRLPTVVVVGLRSREISVPAEAYICQAACAAFVIDPTRRGTVATRQLVDAYGLTAAEAQVAVCALSSGTTSDLALGLGLSRNTVKTHLRRVFAKTGTKKQAELAALLAAIGVVKGQV
ncbi:helix-turn-helix transcriptional regulator [Bradyrhizobium rifense]|uniref:Helix-turn-helix transcriptional regulator n=1 Tax=Bradyrhizobium rifense TaxID=515499 RepID=A0A5D3K4M8_9BRAD|nr:helix-turn-helix transcriptional regulator [Bradyrhizobium rifense]TYL86689.1 helix-turn-helix transcriptional regulator [Bradyrhizobium rifense]